MIQLRRLHDFKDKPDFDNYLNSVNTIRGNYPWSQKSYDFSNSKNVWLVRSPSQPWFGFVEVELKNEDFALDNRMFVFMHDLHFAPSRLRTGAGTAVIHHLLAKGLDLEFVIAKSNDKAWGLVRKFKYLEKFVNENTVTICVPAESENR